MSKSVMFSFLAAISLLGTTSFAASVGSVTGRTDQVFDDTRGLLYLPTNTGQVQRYNPATNTFLTPLAVGTNLNAADITPDGHYLLTTESAISGGLGTIHRVDLTTGLVTDFTYSAIEGRGGWDIVALNDGRAVFSADNPFSGAATPVRSIDIATGVITNFTVGGQAQSVTRQTELWRSGDHTTMSMDDTNTSAGGFSIFSTAAEGYTVNTQLGTPLNGFRVAISPATHGQIALYGLNYSPQVRTTAAFAPVATIADGGGGFAYDPTGTLLYDGSLNMGAIEIYDTSDYHIIGSIDPAGASLNPYDVGQDPMTISGDGKWLFLYSSNGLNVYSITPAVVPEPASCALLALVAGPLLLGRSRRRNRR